jgi:predicted component of type VI protein secretion system
MSKPVPRSRLNITYRTRIEGEPKKVKLPMRFLVLGNFSGKNESMLSERPMHSLLPGMRVDSFMQEMKIASPIEPKDLAMTLVGKLTGTITGVFKKPPEATDTTATVKLTGKGEAAGRGKDNGLGDFAGEVVLVGEHDFTLENGAIKLPDAGETVKLHVKGKVEPSGDFEAGVTGTLDTTIEVVLTQNTAASSLDTSIDFGSPVAGDVKVALTIPLRSIPDFRPDALAARVPEIRRLVLLRRLVLELRSYISSNPLLGVALREQLDKAQAELTAATASADKPLRSTQTTIAQLKAALVEKHPQLLIDPSGPIGGPT